MITDEQFETILAGDLVVLRPDGHQYEITEPPCKGMSAWGRLVVNGKAEGRSRPISRREIMELLTRMAQSLAMPADVVNQPQSSRDDALSEESLPKP